MRENCDAFKRSQKAISALVNSGNLLQGSDLYVSSEEILYDLIGNVAAFKLDTRQDNISMSTG